jgi:signal transduction histidine kinase
MANVVSERTALDRMTRTMYFAIGIATIIFGLLLAPGASGFIGQADQVNTPFLLFSIFIGFLLPGMLSVLGYVLPLSVLRGIVTGIAIGFVACQLLFPLALTNGYLANGGTPWLQGFGPIPATLLAVAWVGRTTWVFALAQGPIVVYLGLTAREGTGIQAVLEGLGAMVSCSIFAGVSLAIMLASARLDSVAERAREQASLEAIAVTREREQTRINAMVHDDIMSVLLAASREPQPAGLSMQAREALTRVEELVSTDLVAKPYAPDELVAVLRATVGSAAPDIAFTYAIDGTDSVPRDVVAALTEATEEAIRNSVLHAGDDATRSVSVEVDDRGLEVVVNDDGRGFSPRDVPQRRLGLRVSILERMRSLPGGDARVRSKAGTGTRISLMWVRP